jgi:hypothetical protein
MDKMTRLNDRINEDNTTTTVAAKTRADQLNAICARYAPGATYAIHTLADGSRKVVLTNPETDDRVGAVGATLEAAIAALDAKVPATQA